MNDGDFRLRKLYRRWCEGGDCATFAEAVALVLDALLLRRMMLGGGAMHARM